jgi:hypothetical protein
MQTIEINNAWFRGAVSIEMNENGLQPWRLPHDQLRLFAAKVVEKAGEAAGVRLAFLTDSTSVELHVTSTDQDRQFDIVIEDEYIGTKSLLAGDGICLFSNLPGSLKRVEIYFPQYAVVTMKSLKIDVGSAAVPAPSKQPRWVTYGSSITQCTTAESPAGTHGCSSHS